ncbi:MAG: DUF4337 domain-containing protein [Armatimonadetes bacterium]|nr:DUF4337 domain-containing protein [Armatimonadota bacterium]
MEDAIDVAQEAAEGAEDRLVSAAAVAIALLATFMAFCGVKGDNTDYAIIQENADAMDQWAMYQAKSMKQYMFELQRDDLQAEMAVGGVGLSAAARGELIGMVQGYEATIERYEGEKKEIKGTAEGHEQARDALNETANKLDLAEVFLSLSVALMAITILTKRRWLFGVSLVPGLIGVLLGLAALAGLPFSVPLPSFLA